MSWWVGLKKKALGWQINRYLTRLAETKDEDEFYREFDDILKGLYMFAGPNRSAVENVRKALQRKHPMMRLAPLLLQKRLSRTAREKLAENFFVDWVVNAKKREKLEEEGFKAP